ncbi:hypothetical protein MMC06_001882 [Schaereria dolodes]|nr:hypothetical protein [Schaereria dolodes]
MPGRSKFSFPMPGCGGSAVHDASAEIDRSTGEHLTLQPIFNPNEKLERLLGASGSVDNSLKENRSRDLLQLRPSFLSVTLSEASQETTNERSANPHRLRTRASSPVLGRNSRTGLPDQESMLSATDSKLQSLGSSSTLQSFYDPTKSSPAISQQTSASSARDMALRKGLRSISSQLCPTLSRDTAQTASEGGDGNKSQLRQAHPRLDLSMLFPKPRVSRGPMLSPNRITSSPSMMSLASESNQPSTPARRNWLRWRSSRSIRTMAEPDHQNRDEQKAPKSIQKYDGNMERHGNGSPQIENLDAFNFAESSKTHMSSDSIQDAPSMPKSTVWTNPRLGPQPTLTHTALARESSRKWGLKSALSTRSRKSEKSNSTSVTILSSVNLHEQSVLVLTSSDDESEDDDSSSRRISQRRSRERFLGSGHGIGNKTTNGEVVKLRCSQHVQGSLLQSSTIPSPKSAYHLGDIEKTDNRQHLSSARVQREENASIRAISTPKTASGQEAPAFSISRISECQHVGDSRMMVVTREEEQLLEAMREKRASMRQRGDSGSHSIVGGRSLEVTPPKRPKTAVADKRASWLFESDMSEFPFPPSSNPSKGFRFLRTAVSSEYLPRETSSSPIQRSAIPQRTSSLLYASRMPPGLSLDPTDLLPSPVTSRGSPVTPPADQASLELYPNENLDIPESKSDHFYQKHLRQRTISSGMIILDGVAENIQHQEGEEGVTEWEMDRYMQS